MKTKIIFLSILAALTTTLRASDYNYLVFTLTDGTTQSITATDLTLTFSEGSLKAVSGTSVLTIPLTSLATMAFSDDAGTTGISTVTAEGITTTDDAEVYDINGRRVPQGSTLQRGIYIIKRNGQTTKVNVK